jgi:hypothetical protein
VHDQVDPRKRLFVVRRIAMPGVAGVVHLAHRAHVDRAAPLRDRLVERDEVAVALAGGDLGGRDRGLAVEPFCSSRCGASGSARRRQQDVERRAERSALAPREECPTTVELCAVWPWKRATLPVTPSVGFEAAPVAPEAATRITSNSPPRARRRITPRLARTRCEF